MALIGVPPDGSRLVGPLGLKKAEQDLIKRRYNQQSYLLQNDLLPPRHKNCQSSQRDQMVPKPAGMLEGKNNPYIKYSRDI
jgi:hypothetical protein